MPNHTDNILKANGDFSLTEVLKPYMTDGNLHFNKINPVPQELMEVASPVRIVSEEEYEEAKATTITRQMGLPITKKISEELFKKYGTDNWYDWCVKNWGTKWSSYDASEIADDKAIGFYTAWSPPIPAIQKLADLTGKSFELYYLGEGNEYIGVAFINPNDELDCEHYDEANEAPDWLKEEFGYEKIEQENED